MSNKKLRVLVVPSDRTGVGYFRSTMPHIALETNYPDEFSVDIDYEPQLNDDNFLKQYDIIHYHRSIGPFEQMPKLLEKFDELGIISIKDLDDYWAPGSHHPAYLIIKANKMDEHIKNNLKIARHITTTTSIFAKEIGRLNKNVYVLPNAIDPTEPQYISKPEPSNRLRIGWLGGSSHLKDLEILQGVVNRLSTDNLLDKVQFVLCGFDLRGQHTEIDQATGQQKVRPVLPKETSWYQYEKIFTDDYRSVSPEYREFLMKFTQGEYPNVANEPYRRVWTKPISSYATNYNLFDVSLAPLEENMFNQCKSQLKVIEAGFHHKAIIAQDFGPYQIDVKSAIQFGGGFDTTANGILVDSKKNHKDWYGAIKKLINNPDMVKTLQDNLFASVKDTYSINKVTEDRKNLYLKLVATKKPNMVLENTL